MSDNSRGPWPFAASKLDGRGATAGAVHQLLASVEAQVAADPARHFSFHADGSATLNVEEGSYRAGKFTTPTIADLRALAAARAPTNQGAVRLTYLLGTGPATDIGSLQATAPAGTLFQAASQFNCLEAPGPRMTAVANYTYDPTQGPRASVSAFPGTFLRHYHAPRQHDPATRFTQSDDDAIDLLGDVVTPHLATMRSGYLMTQDLHDPRGVAAALEAGFERIRVGVHDDVEVVLGANWGGPVAAQNHPVAQVFTSTIALGYSRGGDEHLPRIVQQLQRAAYLGTLLAAVALNKRIVVLTMIGGGVFHNPIDAIRDAILWALDEVAQYGVDLDVIVNSRAAVPSDAEYQRVLRSGGHILSFP